MVRMFGPSVVITALALAGAFYYGLESGQGAVAVLASAAVLAVLEISLSFDNAVVNAKVLERMTKLWQTLFLTVGILIAVFGMRIILPIAIVCVTAGLSPGDALSLALNDQEGYKHEIESAKEAIYAFGGTFLMMIFLDFVLDDERDVHWLGWVERPLAWAGRLGSVSVVVALVALFVSSEIAPDDRAETVLTSGIIGLVVYLAIKSLDDLLSEHEEHEEEEYETSARNPDGSLVTTAAKGGFVTFLYLELLDASFSLDGVVGAFAISSDIVVIAIGLGIGAFWVRSMTIYLVRKGTLANYIYLEHGAHWAIGGLAAIMLLEVNPSVHDAIPSWFTGTIGVVLIIAAVISSLAVRRANADTDPEPEKVSA